MVVLDRWWLSSATGSIRCAFAMMNEDELTSFDDHMGIAR
jgi:hypothetical protein